MLFLIFGGRIYLKILLELDNGDFVFWRDLRRDFDYYGISIEGYMGFQTLQELVDLYKYYLDELYKYLTKNNYKKAEVADWNTIYQTRGVEICYTNNNHYWVFLDDCLLTDPWEAYDYLKDVINQIEEFKKEKELE